MDSDALWAMWEMRDNFGAPLMLAAGRWVVCGLWRAQPCRGGVVVAGPPERDGRSACRRLMSGRPNDIPEGSALGHGGDEIGNRNRDSDGQSVGRHGCILSATIAPCVVRHNNTSATMPPPVKGWRDSFSALYEKHIKGGTSAIHWPARLPFLQTPARYPTNSTSACQTRRDRLNYTIMSNVSLAPKAPAVSPSTAALLSVRSVSSCFMRHPSSILVYLSCSML
jgi:hypothetical protein